MSVEHESIDWESVDWDNTHMDLTFGQYHCGIVDNPKGRFLALAVGPRDDKLAIVLMNEEEFDDFWRTLRQTAKSL